MSAERNKARMLELIERVMNGHDLEALSEFTCSPAVVGSASALVRAFPDLTAEVAWIVAEGEVAVAYIEISGTHRGPWIWVQEPTGRTVSTGLMLALGFDGGGQIIDQWLGSNFVAILGQLGWGVAPEGESVPPSDRPRQSS